eukprot:Nk52_evm18s564 gene=Nk52_evmTU18s564
MSKGCEEINKRADTPPEDTAALTTPRLGHLQSGTDLDLCTIALHGNRHSGGVEVDKDLGERQGQGNPQLQPHQKLQDVAGPIHLSTTYELGWKDPEEFKYSRWDQPTRSECESVIAALESSTVVKKKKKNNVMGEGESDFEEERVRMQPRCLLYSSGMAAIHACVMHLLPIKGRVLIDVGYHGTKQIMEMLAPPLGFTLAPLLEKKKKKERSHGEDEEGEEEEEVQQQDRLVEFMDGDVIWIEVPNNPYQMVYDVKEMLRRKREIQPTASKGGLRIVADLTLAPPPMRRPGGPLWLHTGDDEEGQGGLDVIVHSCTKYLGGHSDVMGGCLLIPGDAPPQSRKQEGHEEGDVASPEESSASFAAYQRLKYQRLLLGSTPGSLDVWLLQRSLKTLVVRVRQQCQTAAQLAAYFHGLASPRNGNRLVTKVHHMSLDMHCAERIEDFFTLKGSIISLEMKTTTMARSLPGLLRFAINATSLGGVETLIDWRKQWDPENTCGRLLRISVGLESFEDLQGDFKQAFCQLSSGQC